MLRAATRGKSFLVTCNFVVDMEERAIQLKKKHTAHINACLPQGLMFLGVHQMPADSYIMLWKSNDEELVRHLVLSDPYMLAGLYKDFSIREYEPVMGQLKNHMT